MTNSSDNQQSTAAAPTTMKCHVCQASWISGQLFWATGKQGRNLDLAGLVCNRMQTLDAERFAQCPNPCKGQTGGDTWEERLGFLEAEEKMIQRRTMPTVDSSQTGT